MNYQLLYKAANNHEAYFINGLLNKNLIRSQLLGGNLSIGIGELPVDVVQVNILVPKNKYDESKKIIANYENNLKLNDNLEEWLCEKCENVNPFNFEICWNCNN